MKYYEDEYINIKPNVISSIFIILSLISLYITFNQYKNGDFNIVIFLIITILLLSIFLSCSFMCLSNIINAKKNQKTRNEIVNNGVKVPGKIIEILESVKNDYKNSIFKRATYFRKFPSTQLSIEHQLYRFAIVEYEYKGETHTIKTPSLNFYSHYLASNDVDVFIYNDKCYVDNFKINYKKIKKNQNNYIKMNLTVVLAFFLMIILIGLTIFLCYIEILNINQAFTSICILIALYLIIGVTSYIKYLFKK